MKSLRLKHALIAAFLLRLAIIPFAFHSDLAINEIWGIYAREFGLRGYYDWLNFGNYARPEYPPLATLLFLAMRYFWELIFKILWFLNTTFSIFPSMLVTWFDVSGYKAVLKLPAIGADIGIGLLLATKSRKAAYYYLFNPAVIYLSAAWGQLESVLGFFVLASVLLVEKKRTAFAAAFALSLATKATMLPIAPALVISSLKDRIGKRNMISATVIFFAVLVVIASPFVAGSVPGWLIEKTREDFLAGSKMLPYLTLNAFNFWGLTYGLTRIPDNVTFAGAPANIVGYIITGFLYFLILSIQLRKPRSVAAVSCMVMFTVFVFLPRMHERYLYGAFVFLPLLAVESDKWRRVLVAVSALFLINLYHWWWVPKIGFLVWTLSFPVVERIMSFALVFFYFYSLKLYSEKKI